MYLFAVTWFGFPSVIYSDVCCYIFRCSCVFVQFSLQHLLISSICSWRYMDLSLSCKLSSLVYFPVIISLCTNLIGLSAAFSRKWTSERHITIFLWFYRHFCMIFLCTEKGFQLSCFSVYVQLINFF